MASGKHRILLLIAMQTGIFVTKFLWEVTATNSLRSVWCATRR